MSRIIKEEFQVCINELYELIDKIEDRQLRADFKSRLGDLEEIKGHIDDLRNELEKNIDKLNDILY